MISFMEENKEASKPMAMVGEDADNVSSRGKGKPNMVEEMQKQELDTYLKSLNLMISQTKLQLDTITQR